MRLRYDPFQIFKTSRSPAGLYARQKWLGQADTTAWRKDYDQTVAALLADPFPEILTPPVAIETVRRLFGLHLTVRSPTAVTHAALTRLLNLIDLQSDRIEMRLADDSAPADLTALPFTQSRLPSLITGATLFLASIFGREQDPDVWALFEWLCTKGIGRDGCWMDAADTHNVFRALVVHPHFSQSEATARAVAFMAGRQTGGAHWGSRLPFYQTLNALAHLNQNQRQVKEQLGKAFQRLPEMQNRDGSWGAEAQEWNTFLVVHALRNSGIL
jgi:hypothetical protein